MKAILLAIGGLLAGKMASEPDEVLEIADTATIKLGDDRDTQFTFSSDATCELWGIRADGTSERLATNLTFTGAQNRLVRMNGNDGYQSAYITGYWV